MSEEISRLSRIIKERLEDIELNPKSSLSENNTFSDLGDESEEIMNNFNKISTLLAESVSKNEILEASLVSSQKLESLGTMAAGMAHEFNNILQPISGFSDILRNSDDIPEKYKDWLDIVYTSSQRGSGLVDQIMNFSRRNKDSSKELCKVSDIMTEFYEMMSMSKELNITLEIDNFVNPEHKILVNKSEIIQVLVNLYNNAIHAVKNEESGVISVLSTNTSSLNNMDTQKEWVVIEVKDNGYGITKSALEKIFDPFYTTKPIGEGTGLGLSVINNIIRGNNASIEVESEEGVGTTFRIIFKVGSI